MFSVFEGRSLVGGPFRHPRTLFFDSRTNMDLVLTVPLSCPVVVVYNVGRTRSEELHNGINGSRGEGCWSSFKESSNV